MYDPSVWERFLLALEGLNLGIMYITITLKHFAYCIAATAWKIVSIEMNQKKKNSRTIRVQYYVAT